MRFLFLTVFSCFVVLYFLVAGKCKSNTKNMSTSQCLTPDGKLGECVKLNSCAILWQAYESRDPDLEKFVEDSICGNQKITVCCPPSPNATKPQVIIPSTTTVHTILDEKTQKELKRNHTLKKLLPTQTYCGMQHYDDYFHENEEQVSVDEFPWLLDLESQAFSLMGGRIITCSAVLISKRYALTINECLVPEYDTRYTYSARIKFGAYGWRVNVSCIDTRFGEDCTEPLTQIYVEEKIHIENSEIVLLRLENSVMYGDYVRPICLPMEDNHRPKLNDTVQSSGWGTSQTSSEWTKFRNINRIASEEECKALSPEPTQNENEEYYYLQNEKELECVLDVVPSATHCTITVGSSTMFKYKNNWYADGILKEENCTQGVHYVERITPDIVDFILENMRD